ncbi:unnamed protein product [Pieris macdunnoughi]|uniref:MADF domain-containing protein n=1 Tax=Pieris macdunnoughi TaxID=345717 RepID=A0A821WIQ8_9NEOP|nr:unnamed protein product [Pieris macdunnoughi]
MADLRNNEVSVTPLEEVKNKWSKLRNCFTNALKRRRKKSGQTAAKAVPWKFEKQMGFLLPYVEGRSTVTNLSKSNDGDSTQDFEYQFSEESAVSLPPTIRSPTPGTSPLRPSIARASTQNSSASFTTRRIDKNDNDNNVLKEMVNVPTEKKTQEMRQKRAVSDT